MPRITVHAVNHDGRLRQWTLSERIATENLDSDHYSRQLIERLAWATADAEAQESRSDRHRDGRRPDRRDAGTSRAHGHGTPGRSPERAHAQTADEGSPT